jgi:tyrosine-protein phosphatase non-receptor type 9
MTLQELLQHVKSRGRAGIYAEYGELKAKPLNGSFDASRQRQNVHKNRYTDVLCYDHSRVLLERIDNDPFSDYINANYVDGYKSRNAFIFSQVSRCRPWSRARHVFGSLSQGVISGDHFSHLSHFTSPSPSFFNFFFLLQGPLPKTFPDFWRMIWEQRVLVIVMTTRITERGRVKCGQYWPDVEGSSALYGNFRVVNKAVQTTSDYVHTMFTVINDKVRSVLSC